MRRRAGFTLAEVAITIVIVGIGLTLVLQGLNASQLTAAHTRNMRLARELGLRTLGEIASGLWWEDFSTNAGLYDVVYEDHPDFRGEIALADEPFLDDDLDEDSMDTWAERERIREDREREAREGKDDEEDEEEAEEPYEKVRVRVRFTKFQDLPDHLDLERWMPWEQVYGPDEDEPEEPAAGAGEASEPEDGG